MQISVRIKQFICFCVISLLPIMQVYSDTFLWDPAGTNVGDLGGLNLDIAETSQFPIPNNYLSGEYYSYEGFLGRFVYEGDDGEQIVFTDIGPVLDSSLGNYFYYSKTDDTRRYRRVFFVATVKALRHPNGGDPIFLNNTNIILEQSGDSLIIPSGAGSEVYDTTAPDYVDGYNASGEKGSGSSYFYVYPYRLIWIDLTVIRTTTSNLRNGGYELKVSLSGEDISTTLNLTGYRRNTGTNPDSYFFQLDRISAEYIPIYELMQKNSFTNSLLVGRVAYSSADIPAEIRFASNVEGTEANFTFSNVSGSSFPYELIYSPIIPSGGTAVKIESAYTTFQSYNPPQGITSPVYGEVTSLYALQGDMKIYVDQNFSPVTLSPGDYSSNIYCFLSSL